MAKLKLDLNDVSVESFPTTPPDPRSDGTVQGLQSTLQFTCVPGGCLGTYGCDTAYCYESQQIACPTATCQAGCTANCPTYPDRTWNQTCPVTCDWGNGCESTQPNCPL
ncbi:hypothetical protein [Longimicrobium sp.]|uniref:hypothetical protein n=1 Tax=Longimicrobium sp. TaxID=2029185 RepID=UPI002E367D6C|nr:hypothetical protein [Longimicrobium sp.]HEX6040692.1 hypothetical protein [Longimicrobium sp.]